MRDRDVGRQSEGTEMEDTGLERFQRVRGQ